MSDFTDEDVRRGVAASPYLAEPVVRVILAAVLPEYRKRVLREAADAIPAAQTDDPYDAAGDWLRARADAEEGK